MNLNENSKVKGEITAKFYDQKSLSFLSRLINKFILKFRSEYPNLMKLYRLGRLKGIDYHTNVICNAGFACLAKIITGDDTYSGTGEITKMALGTGAGTPAASDVALFTESYRNAVASATSSSNIAFLTAYFSETECDGTYTEFGNFIDGGAGADSGDLWSHIAGLNWVKDDTTVLVVSCKYTFASA